jgi:protein SCO1
MKKSQAGLADKHIFLIIFLIAIAAGLGLWLGGRVSVSTSPQASAPTNSANNTNIDPRAYKSLLVYPNPKIIAPFRLQNVDGSEFTEAQLQGQWSLLSFGFTSCPDVCPTLLTEIKPVLTKIAEPKPHMVFVSIDPERDTPAVLKDYVQHFDATFIGATGDIPNLTQFAASLGALFEKEATGTGAMDYTMAHTATIFLINPQGQLAAIARPQEQSRFDWAQLGQDIPAFLAANAITGDNK